MPLIDTQFALSLVCFNRVYLFSTDHSFLVIHITSKFCYACRWYCVFYIPSCLHFTFIFIIIEPGFSSCIRSLNLSEYQRDTHVLNYHRSRESSLLTFLLRDGHFPYEHLAVFYRQLITRKDVTTESDRSIEQECDDSRKPIGERTVNRRFGSDDFASRELLSARKPWDEDLRKTGTGPTWEAGWTLYLVTSENGGQRMGKRTVDAKLSCFVPDQLLHLIPLGNIWPFMTFRNKRHAWRTIRKSFVSQSYEHKN